MSEFCFEFKISTFNYYPYTCLDHELPYNSVKVSGNKQTEKQFSRFFRRRSWSPDFLPNIRERQPRGEPAFPPNLRGPGQHQQHQDHSHAKGSRRMGRSFNLEQSSL